MKKIILLLTLLLSATVGIYFVNTYTSAMVESPVSLSINNPHGMISLIPVEGLAVEQGKSTAALTVTNNMEVSLYNCRLV